MDNIATETTPTGFPSTTITIRRGDIASALHRLGYMSIGIKRDEEIRSATNFTFATNLKRTGDINSLDDIKMVSAEEFAKDYATVLTTLRLDGDTIEIKKRDYDYDRPSFKKFDKKYRDFGKSLRRDGVRRDSSRRDTFKRGGYKKDTIVENKIEGTDNG